MKSILFTSAFLFFQLTQIEPLAAQDTTPATEPTLRRVEFGLRFMPTVSSFKMQSSSGGTVTGQGTFGYGIGGLLAFNFNKHYGIQAEIIYNSLSQKYKDQELNREIHLKYVNIPILFSLNTGKSNPINLNVVVGPQFGYNLGSSIKKSSGSGSDTITTIIATKRSDFGMAYGAGLEFVLNSDRTIRFDFGYRGVFGLVNISDKSQSEQNGSSYTVEKAKVRTNSLYFGFAFIF